MKHATLVLILLILASALFSQSQGIWAAGAGSTYSDYCLGMAKDSAGNSYLTGQYSGDATFGDIILSSQSTDIFVAKLGPDGNWVWAVSAGGSSLDSGNGIFADNSGNIYVTGYFSNTAEFGTQSITSSGDQDIFVAKLDNSGNWQWAARAGGTNTDAGHSVAIDPSGIIHVAGYFSTTATFGTTSLTSSGSSDIFLAKTDSTGNWVGAVKAGGTGSDHCYDLAVDSAGACYVAGRFNGSILFGSIPLTSAGAGDIFTAKYSSGSWQWAVRAGGTNEDYCQSIALDNTGNCYITGSFSGTADFNVTSLNSFGNLIDLYVAKIGNNGIWQWAVKGGSYSSDYGYCITADCNGYTYVTGYFQSNAYFGSSYLICLGNINAMIAKLDPDGNWLWANKAGSTTEATGRCVVIMDDGYICMGGYFKGALTFCNLSLPNNGQNDIFAIRFSDPIPSTPQNVTINNLANDIHLHWDAVTTDTDGNPLAPDYYFIYYNYDQTPGGDYYFLDFTPANIRNYVHQYAGLYSTEYFYNVRAVKYYSAELARQELDAYLTSHLHEGMSKAEVEAVLHNINLQ